MHTISKDACGIERFSVVYPNRRRMTSNPLTTHEQGYTDVIRADADHAFAWHRPFSCQGAMRGADRQIAKSANFGLLYHLSAGGFAVYA
jgi:hypothetical protein